MEGTGAPELDDTLVQALEALGDRLRRDKDRDTRHALQVEVLALAGYKPAEIRHRLGLSAEDLRFARRTLERSLRRLGRDDE